MKGRLLVTVSIGVVGIVFVLILYFVPSLRPSERSAPPVSVSREEVDCGYLLTLENGFVAVKQIGVKTPCRVFDLPGTMLSDFDRAMLERGILCASVEEAERVAADFVG